MNQIQNMHGHFDEVLLYSGGLDSYIAYHFLHRPATFYLPLNHRYEKFEKEAIIKTIPNTWMSEIFNLGPFEHEDADIPMRNAYLMMGAAMLGAKKIHLVVQKGEISIPDRKPAFFNQMSHFLSDLNGKEIIVSSPFFGMTKVEMVEWYLNVGLDPKDLLKTRSCYSMSDKPCGHCGACFRRWVALTYNNLSEPMLFNILEWEGTKAYVQKILDGKYDPQRARETISALKMAGYKFPIGFKAVDPIKYDFKP
jgi:hypothetical protein